MFEKLWEYLKDRFSLLDILSSALFAIIFTVLLYPNVAPLEDHEIVSIVLSLTFFILVAMNLFKRKILRLEKKDEL